MMKKTIIRAFCIAVAMLLGWDAGAMAQTFYEIEYTDRQGYTNRGLFIYFDEEDCTVIMRRHKPDGGNLSIEQWNYQSVKDDIEGIDCLIMACEDDDTPLFLWIWDKNETEEQQAIPYVVLDEDDDPDEWVRASLFYEDNLNYLTPEYLELFLDPECELYGQMVAAYNERVANLDDGEDVYNVVSNAVLTARGESTEEAVLDKGVGNSCSISSRPVLHLFVVANTEVADIGQACRTDYRNIVSEMRGITQSIGISMKQYKVTGDNYSVAAVRQQLKNLKPSANDIVVFLYTGHGFRLADQTDPYPLLALTTNDYEPIDGNYMALSDIYKAICDKGARLNIVLGDCCNSELAEQYPLGCSTLFSRGSNNFSRKRLQELFFNSKGSILSTAASPGEYSWCDTSGGMFTVSFIQSLRKEISAMNTSDVSWQSIVNNTINTARQRSRNNAQAQNGLKKVAVSKQ